MPTPTTVTPPTEVLVSSLTPTQLDPTPLTDRQWIEITNNGPNPIWIVPTVVPGIPTITVGKAIRVEPNGSWPMTLGPSITVWALAETANQASGAATVVTQYA